jgi:hypothetical protein
MPINFVAADFLSGGGASANSLRKGLNVAATTARANPEIMLRRFMHPQS